ncbi:MAG: N-acetylglucosamine-6-phosphate deacetylase [Cellulosilyticaceae bacterium]
MKCIYNGKILLNGEILEGKAILFDEKIVGIVDEQEALDKASETIDAKASFISPGFVDIHIHGYAGVDTMDGTTEAITKIAEGVKENGVTSFLPTTMTMSKDEIIKALEAARLVKAEGTNGAQVLGVHMEGPYFNIAFKGAQNPAYLVNPGQEEIDFVKSYQDIIKVVSIAPEIEGAKNFIKTISTETDITLSMGHTAATFDEAMEGIACGISHTTHLFNAMTPLHHRNPGVVGAALASDVSCEAICDTIHINPGLYPLVAKTKADTNKFVLVTDCMCAGGCPQGEYALGGQKVIVNENSARLEDGTLAGSVLRLNEAVKNVLAHTDLSVAKVIEFASLNPAKVIGVDGFKGTLDAGKDADIIIFDENITILKTIAKGKTIYENSSI